LQHDPHDVAEADDRRYERVAAAGEACTVRLSTEKRTESPVAMTDDTTSPAAYGGSIDHGIELVTTAMTIEEQPEPDRGKELYAMMCAGGLPRRRRGCASSSHRSAQHAEDVDAPPNAMRQGHDHRHRPSIELGLLPE